MVDMLSRPNRHNQTPKGLQRQQQQDIGGFSANTSPFPPLRVMIAILLDVTLPHLLHYSEMKRNLVI